MVVLVVEWVIVPDGFGVNKRFRCQMGFRCIQHSCGTTDCIFASPSARFGFQRKLQLWWFNLNRIICLGLQTSGEYDEQLRLNNFCRIRGRVANRGEAAVPKRKESARTKKGEYCYFGCSSVFCRSGLLSLSTTFIPYSCWVTPTQLYRITLVRSKVFLVPITLTVTPFI